MDTITYLPHPNYSLDFVPLPLSQRQTEDADSIALKKRVEKYAGADDKPVAVQLADKKGKWKAM